LTRLQRASKGSGESPPGGRDDVVERRGVRFENFGWNLVMLGDGSVDAERHGIALSRQPGFAERAFNPLDSDVRAIDDWRCRGGHGAVAWYHKTSSPLAGFQTAGIGGRSGPARRQPMRIMPFMTKDQHIWEDGVLLDLQDQVVGRSVARR
jgi:hypothetical protein